MSDYLDQLAVYICGCRFEDLPSHVVQRSREVVADSLAVIAVGAQEEEVQALTGRVVSPGGKEAATVIGAGIRTESSKAALINGTAGTFLELDEGNQFARGHPGIHVIPAALAVAEEMNLSGRDLLTALVLGYEIGARIGIASKLRMSMHPHGTWGTVGAAVAVGKLMSYEENAIMEIINVSSSLGLATSRQTMLQGGTVRNVYAGASGYMGILSHDLVQSGFTGEADGLQTVFGSVVSDTFVPEEMTKDLGGRSLAAQLCDQNPGNTLAGKFSVPFAVATLIVNGSTGVESFTPGAIQDPAARALAQRVTVSEDPKLTAMMPQHRPSRVKVTLTDGTVLEAQALTNKGDTEDPYSSEELRAKYFELAERIWKPELAEAIYADAMKLDQLDNVNQMTARMG